MSDADYIKPGETVTIDRPKKAGKKKDNSGCQSLFLIGLALLAVIYVLSKSSTSPTGGVISSPVAFSAGVSLECASDIAVGQRVSIVNVNAVRLRNSPGYVGKAEADTLHYMARGEQVQVQGGPQKRDGLCWWWVEYQGVQGWAANHSERGVVLLSAVP